MRRDGVLLYKTSDSASARKGGEADVDELGGIEVAVEISVKFESGKVLLNQKSKWKASESGDFDLPTSTNGSRENDTSGVDGLPDIC